jgi:hypothetical protein
VKTEEHLDILKMLLKQLDSMPQINGKPMIVSNCNLKGNTIPSIT